MPSMVNGYCSVCEGGCHWEHHKNLPYLFVHSTKIVQRTMNEVKANYEEHSKQKFTLEGYLTDARDEFARMQSRTIAMLDEMCQCKIKLAEIALRPNPITSTQHVEQLIRAEETEARPGWQNRVMQLKNILQRWEAVNEVDSGGNPVQKILDQYLVDLEDDAHARRLLEEVKLENRQDEAAITRQLQQRQQWRQQEEAKARQIAHDRRLAEAEQHQQVLQQQGQIKQRGWWPFS